MGSLSSCWIPRCQPQEAVPAAQRGQGGEALCLPAQTSSRAQGTVFHSTRKWFITQCERTGVPEHFTATLVGHHSARSANKLTYGLYSAGISAMRRSGGLWRG